MANSNNCACTDKENVCSLKVSEKIQTVKQVFDCFGYSERYVDKALALISDIENKETSDLILEVIKLATSDKIHKELELDVRDEVLNLVNQYIDEDDLKYDQIIGVKEIKSFLEALKNNGFNVGAIAHLNNIGNNNKVVIQKDGVKLFIHWTYGIYHGIIFWVEESCGMVPMRIGGAK